MLLTVTQAAKRTGVHRRKLLRAIGSGKLKAQKTGDSTSLWLINTTDLDRYAAHRDDR